MRSAPPPVSPAARTPGASVSRFNSLRGALPQPRRSPSRGRCNVSADSIRCAEPHRSRADRNPAAVATCPPIQFAAGSATAAARIAIPRPSQSARRFNPPRGALPRHRAATVRERPSVSRFNPLRGALPISVLPKVSSQKVPADSIRRHQHHVEPTPSSADPPPARRDGRDAALTDR